jgi:hypothetical protein
VNRRHRHRNDIVACFTLDFSADFATALDDDPAFEARPTMALLKPLDVVNVVVRVSMRPWSPSTVVSRLISGSTNPLAFCSVTNSSASSRSEPWLPFSASFGRDVEFAGQVFRPCSKRDRPEIACPRSADLATSTLTAISYDA